MNVKDVKLELNELSKLGVKIPKISNAKIKEIIDPSMSVTEAADLVLVISTLKG